MADNSRRIRSPKRRRFARRIESDYTRTSGVTKKYDMNNDSALGFGGFGSDPASPLNTVERLIASLPPGNPLRSELIDLRSGVAEQEEMIAEARQPIEQLDEVIKKVTSPANRIGTFLGTPNRETAQIVVGGSDYYCNVDPRVPIDSLRRGTRVSFLGPE